MSSVFFNWISPKSQQDVSVDQVHNFRDSRQDSDSHFNLIESYPFPISINIISYPIAQLIPQQQRSFVSYRWSPDTLKGT